MTKCVAADLRNRMLEKIGMIHIDGRASAAQAAEGTVRGEKTHDACITDVYTMNTYAS